MSKNKLKRVRALQGEARDRVYKLDEVKFSIMEWNRLVRLLRDHGLEARAEDLERRRKHYREAWNEKSNEDI